MDTYRPTIILLSGWAGAGKDLLGAWLGKEHSFKRYAFADPVKDAAAQMFGFDRALADTAEGKATPVPSKYTVNWAALSMAAPAPPTVRDLLIQCGETARKVNPGAWAEDIAAAILRDRPDKIVLTDWRNLDEFLTLQRRIPGATFYFLSCVKPGQRYSSVADRTEYSLLGFPMDAEVRPTHWIETARLLWMECYESEREKLERLLQLRRSVENIREGVADESPRSYNNM